jgi:anaerobic magnesium-protoporphyrin IX monomethyl ester cyclase
VNVLLLEVNPYVPISLPISLGYLAAVLREQGHRVQIVNIGEGTPFSARTYLDLVRDFRPRLVGFAAYQRNMLHLRGLARAAKDLDPSVKVILGGPQATFMPSESLAELPDVDYLCRGEGEIVIQEVVKALEGGTLNEAVPGTTTRLGPDQWQDGSPIVPPEDLDLYPSPFLDDVFDLRGLEEAIMLTSRGCPYGCVFCYTPKAFGRKIRCHSVERVCEEMAWLNGRGVERFWLADPSFSLRRERTERLLHEMMLRKIRARIWLETRADLVDAELLRLMAAAGVGLVAYGLESAAEHVLKGLGKEISLSRLRWAVALAQDHGIDVELFSQYGLPRERFEDALRTLEFVKSCVPVRGNSNAQQTRLYFGTALHDRVSDFGIRPLDGKRPAYISIGPRYETEWMNQEEIHRIGGLWKEASQDGGKRMVS